MNERLLQYIWQFQYLNNSDLETTAAQSLQVIFAGMYNTNQGPDFLNAKIKIGEATWAGSVELHINSSDWKRHNHSNDKNYNNVILHVVWNHDVDLSLPFPTLEIHTRVSKLLLKKYEELMQNRYFIPCEEHIHKVSELTLSKLKERLLIERLQQKALCIEEHLKKNNQHWEECFWWMLARNFGTKINSDAFEKIARTIPINILAKHKHQLLQLEALLMGQAGLLDKNFTESYPIMLQKEYQFLRKKYQLKNILHPLHFLRMRPANFPTVRLAQLATIIQQSHHLFGRIKDMADLKEAQALFNVTANDYWHYHYVFDETSPFKKKALGREMTRNIMINTVIPMLYAYGYLSDKETFKNKAVHWVAQLGSETNSITKGFVSLGVKNDSAFDSQALLQLKNFYCDQKHCLTCAVGNELLKAER
ncbi:MAG: DUF2851 family protein [Ferruginibacter sp.]|nr:DUF2851 family protein [Ferruginibacter sp.]